MLRFFHFIIIHILFLPLFILYKKAHFHILTNSVLIFFLISGVRKTDIIG